MDEMARLLDERLGSMATKEDVQQILSDRLSTMETTITNNVKRHFDETITNLVIKTQKLEAELYDKNGVIDGLRTEIGELRGEMKKLHSEVDDQINRNMRNNIIIKDLPEVNSDDEREDTRQLVITTLADMSDGKYSEDYLDQYIDRAHRGKKLRDGERRGPRHVYVKFLSSQLVDDFVLFARSSDGTIRIDKQYSKPVTDRRNLAFMERKTLKRQKTIVGGYVEFPAKLMVKFPGQKKYTLHKEF